MSPAHEEPYLSASALARALGISRTTVHAAIASGAIVGYRLHGQGRRMYLLSEARQAFKPVLDLGPDLKRSCEAAAKRARTAHDRKYGAFSGAPHTKAAPT